MIKAVIFDMDGLLIDSEPLWMSEEAKLFASVGIHITKDMHHQTYGLSPEEVVSHWYSYKPWKDKTLAEMHSEMIGNVEEKLIEGCQLKEGATYILDFFHERRFKIALASSSPLSIINKMLERHEIRHYFNAVLSSEHETHGKPHPAVYLSAAKKIEVPATLCLVFEDSINGMIAAKAARMKTVAIPESFALDDPKYAIADLKLDSLLQFNEVHLSLFQ